MKLAGYRVVDVSQFLPGPHLTMLMADHGADVIKVEPPGIGDAGRQIGLRQDDETVFFRNANRGKRSVGIDIGTPESYAEAEDFFRGAEPSPNSHDATSVDVLTRAP